MTTNLYLLGSGRSPLKKKLLSYFLQNPEASLYLREIALKIQVDPANLSRELSKLQQEGLFKSVTRGNQKYFSINHAYPLYREMESIFRKTAVKEPASDDFEYAPAKGKAAKQPRLYVIAGPNGAGKTTFAKTFLPAYADCKEFVNADLIATGLSPFSPESAALSAGKLLIQKTRELAAKKSDFGFETTLSGKSYIPFLKDLRAQGYRIDLFFLWIPTLELALARIRDRVKRGGHHIPDEVVKRRFHKGIKHLFGFYESLLDAWMLFDNSGTTPRLIAKKEKGYLQIADEKLYEKISIQRRS